jgi:acyl-CoA synthetase (AMP-forming)/AMP-acid ligase II
MLENSILDILQRQANQQKDEVALVAPDRQELSYQRLVEHVTATTNILSGLGIKQNDRVAIVLPNGPDMVTAFLAVASAAISAPLNPHYQAPEYEFYLSDLNAKALIIEEDDNSPVIEIARKHQILIIRLQSLNEAGVFTLRVESDITESSTGKATPNQIEDVALVLHTSGTTSRPKIVQLTQQNIITSAQNIAETLALKTTDRCLNVMPLFHIHGLMAAVMGSLWSGASIVCCPGFQAPKFFSWLETYQATWYTAVPTMHQSILLRAKDNQDILTRTQLRFVRSSSASLPPSMLEELEQTFRAPVIEAYGMTEAAHQMSSNPLPPQVRKSGTVGLAAGPEVAIMDEANNLLPSGEIGEIVIRGANVTPGYDNNPDANTSAFTNGWFRTGDQGFMESEGYLTITGRLKEIINRGGEKISPREVDELLMTHPAVLQAVAFAIPHSKLGEDIAAAVVLHADQTVSEQELGEFAAQNLAYFKVPQQIVILNKIPTGSTGKLQRIGLAEKLGVKEISNSKALDWTLPRTKNEKLISNIWEDILDLRAEGDRPALGIHSRFLDLGGDSVLAIQIASRINSSLAIDFPLRTLFETPTVARLTEAVDTILWMQSREDQSADFKGEEINI